MIDAATVTPDGVVHFFSGGLVLPYLLGGPVPGPVRPAEPISLEWPGLTFTAIDAAFTSPRGVTYFFSGSQYAKSDSRTRALIAGARPIRDHWNQGYWDKVPSGWDRDLSAACVWPESGKAYWFKGQHYLRYNLDRDRVDTDDSGGWGYPLRIADYWKLGFTEVDACFCVAPNTGYFFRGADYVRYDLRADAVLAAGTLADWKGLTFGAAPVGTFGPLGSTTTGFRPSVHGFAFPNSFTTPPALITALTVLVPAAHWLAVPGGYGLCGGMVASALDHFLAARPIPATTTVPGATDALHLTLVDRQLDSLELNAASLPSPGAPVRKFLAWMAMPDRGSGSVAEASLPEVVAIVAQVRDAALRRANPPTVGLVQVDGTGSMLDNHQVLVTGVRVTSGTEVVLEVYDPNEPRDDRIEIVATVSGREVAFARAPVPGRIRGVFRIPYAPAPPP